MVMRSLLGPLFLLGLLLATPMGGRALELPDGSADAIRQVIERQIAAFRADDGAAAFAHASPTVRRIFGDVETFMTMVRRDYQPVYRPRTFEFREVVEWRGQPTQEVVVVGPDGRVVLALYSMELQPDGDWLINGCTLMALPDAAA